MLDIVASGQQFSDHFYGKPTTAQVVAVCTVSFRVGDNTPRIVKRGLIASNPFVPGSQHLGE